MVLILHGTGSALAQTQAAPAAVDSASTRALLAALSEGREATKPPPAVAAFRAPPQAARPRIRYWTPQAAVTEAGVRRDIQNLAAQGFGGLELVAMDRPTGVPDDYGWGTPRWNRIMQVAAEEAARLGLTFSVANGPSWPIAMPGVASAEDPSSLFELTYGQQLIEAGSRFEGRAPPGRVRRSEGSPRLVALLAYPLVGERTLDPARAVDLTAAADAAGGLVAFAPPTRDQRWMLVAFWGQPAAQKVGSLYVIDHFSAAGARQVRAYWDQIFSSVLAPGALDDLFNDSLEYKVAMDWTRDLPAVFRAQHGYDLAPYLPFIGVGTTYPKNDVPGFESPDPVRAAQVNQDYLDTLTALHIENHLAPLQALAKQHGATVRYQVGYNKPLAIETLAAAVGVPETEALGRAAIDGMRQMAAAVHILDKPQFSVESAAEFGDGYGQSLRDITWWSKRAWAAGVNAETLHGAAYDGGYEGPGNDQGALPGLVWPGYHAFGGKVTNVWNRQTAPFFSQVLTDYLARGNTLLRRRAKVDVAIFRAGLDVFNDPSVGHGDGEALYPDGGALADRGFSYDFVSPALLALPQSQARDGMIAPSGPGYRALLVPSAPFLSMADLVGFEAFAAQGVRIIFIGPLPRHSRSYGAVLRGETDEQVAAALTRLLARPGVRQVQTYGQVPLALGEMGVAPDAQVMDAPGVLAQHRVDGPTDLYYLYNYNKVSGKDASAVVNPSPEGTSYPRMAVPPREAVKTVRLSLAGQGRPYLLNAWSGSISPIAAYTARPGRVELTLAFQSDEALFVALMDDQTARASGLTPPARHVGADQIANQDIGYADGVLVRRRPSASAMLITDWRMTFAGVAKPADGASAYATSARPSLGPFSLGARLAPLRELSPALRDLSGLATYRSQVTLPAFSPRRAGYLLDLGRVEGAYQVSVNGQVIHGADQQDPVVDLSAFLRGGVNDIAVSVATTLCGSVKCEPARHEGLLGAAGQVYLRPYRIQPLHRARQPGPTRAGVANLRPSPEKPR
ncbi:glycosyl hydrolase [Caulobacter radicis]|uniref:Glycoside hydrolase n=1 Tax=Caulobacter radicis TaxID=2172650 RepID=A0A2T9J7E0_9CAUL|nr:glycosyl hydrolase [Caulobacter radicis]PVM77468.1 hypothetical protein DDF65_16175 [Caulobacter radicis]